jgi:succinate dehydrogenase / fumarate reductase, cytochrome b subunit
MASRSSLIPKVFRSSIGKKFLMALTGLGLVVFVITHLAGNLALYKSEGSTFNAYTQGLAGFGFLLYIAEVGLLLAFLVHIVTAILIKRGHKEARPVRYVVARPKNGPTQSNLSSRNMISSGVILLIFLVLHIWQFKYGPGINDGYVTDVNGVQGRDLYRLVVETFHQPLYVVIYVGAMLFLGLHLRHGFWSAFQSLGAMNPRFTRLVYALGFFIAAILALGFLFIPIWIYFDLSQVVSSIGGAA